MPRLDLDLLLALAPVLPCLLWSLGSFWLRGWVVTARVEGMAADDPPEAEVRTFGGPVQAQAFVRVARARGLEPASRPQERRDQPLIQADQQHQEPGQHGTQCSSNARGATQAGQCALPLLEQGLHLPFAERPPHDDHDIERVGQLAENCAKTFAN